MYDDALAKTFSAGGVSYTFSSKVQVADESVAKSGTAVCAGDCGSFYTCLSQNSGNMATEYSYYCCSGTVYMLQRNSAASMVTSRAITQQAQRLFYTMLVYRTVCEGDIAGSSYSLNGSSREVAFTLSDTDDFKDAFYIQDNDYQPSPGDAVKSVSVRAYINSEGYLTELWQQFYLACGGSGGKTIVLTLDDCFYDLGRAPVISRPAFAQ